MPHEPPTVYDTLVLPRVFVASDPTRRYGMGLAGLASCVGGEAPARKRNRERGSWPVIGHCPKTTMVSVDDRSAHGQPDTHPAALRRIEGVEQLVHAVMIEADARIPYRQAHVIGALAFSSDEQLPGAIAHGDHGVRGIADQI